MDIFYSRMNGKPKEAKCSCVVVSRDILKAAKNLKNLKIHRKKRFTSFPSPAGMSLTKLPLGRNNSVMTSLFPPRESLVVTSPGWGRETPEPFYLRCVSYWAQSSRILVFTKFLKSKCVNPSVGKILLKESSMSKSFSLFYKII
jgi:hypothetical protein